MCGLNSNSNTLGELKNFKGLGQVPSGSDFLGTGSLGEALQALGPFTGGSRRTRYGQPGHLQKCPRGSNAHATH